MFDKELGRGQPIEGGLGHGVLRLRAEVARLTHWQRTVAAELGWCEAVDGSVPAAEHMAGVAKVHGESHMRLKDAEAEVERLRGVESTLREDLLDEIESASTAEACIAEALSILESDDGAEDGCDCTACRAIAALKGKP